MGDGGAGTKHAVLEATGLPGASIGVLDGTAGIVAMCTVRVATGAAETL